MNPISLFQMTFLFWVILDSVGSIPLYVSTLKDFEPAKQRQIIWREMFIALAVMILFFFVGEGFFNILGISKATLQTSGGIILLIIALQMIFPSSEVKERAKKTEPLIVPLAVPAIAGPGILATISLYAGSGLYSPVEILTAIFLAWLFSLPFVLLSSWLKKFLGHNGLMATERLFGYLVLLIAIQMAMNGIFAEFHLYAP